MLIVEDQDIMRQMLREFLQSAYPDARILEAGSGDRALALCREHRPRLVLMDVKLPDANGIELTAQAKALLPETTVIVISQDTALTYVERARAAGAFAYVAKHNLQQRVAPRCGECAVQFSNAVMPIPRREAA